MNTSPDSRWLQAVKIFQSNVAPEEFDRLFSGIVFEKYLENEQALIIRLPSAYVYNQLESSYRFLLREVLDKCFPKGTQLKYRVLTDKEHKLSQDWDPDPTIGFTTDTTKDNEKQEKVYLKNKTNKADKVEVRELNPQLNPMMVFENYIEGESNKLPRSVGLSVAEHPNTSQFNPMFIYGPSGCGKTHLINAIGMRTKQLYPHKRVLYVSARLFQVQFTEAVLQNKSNDFINFYQSIDMIIVDDVQEWMTATRTQETFFHIFNHLFKNGKRIILASDRPPVKLETMPERLINRFSCGLTAEIEKPNVQLCVDILYNKIRRDGLQIPEEVIRFIAETANGSIRDLQGVITSLLAYSVVYNSSIDMKLAERVIKRAIKIDNKPLTVDDILEVVSKHYKVTVGEIHGKSRKAEIVKPRQVATFLALKYTKMPANRIGKLIGGRDHSTVIHSCQRIEKLLKTDMAFAQEMTLIEKKFKIKG